MAEYIERETALEAAKKSHLYFDIKPIINSIPAADVRPVVLCKDCKCYRQSSFVDKHMECARSGFPVHPVDFCSCGEKREAT